MVTFTHTYFGYFFNSKNARTDGMGVLQVLWLIAAIPCVAEEKVGWPTLKAKRQAGADEVELLRNIFIHIFN